MTWGISFRGADTSITTTLVKQQNAPDREKLRDIITAQSVFRCRSSGVFETVSVNGTLHRISAEPYRVLRGPNASPTLKILMRARELSFELISVYLVSLNNNNGLRGSIAGAMFGITSTHRMESLS